MAEVSPEYVEQVAKTVADLYGDATADMIRTVARRLARGIDGDGWAEAKLVELLQLRADAQAIVAQLTETMPTAVTDAIETAAAKGRTVAATELKLSAPITTRVNTAAIEALARETVDRLAVTHLQILRGTLDAYSSVVAEVSAPGVVTGTSTRRQAAQRALDRWAEYGVTGFRDRAGRNWAIESYAEMTTRTASGRAMVQGSLDTYVADGRNFVMVSDAPQECKACRPWEGKVLSIDGTGVGTTVGGFRVVASVREATADGLLHANCRHRLSPVVPGLTRAMHGTADPEGDRARQEQRRLERGIRQWKRREAAALDDVTAAKAKAKVREWQGKLREHVTENDLKRLPYRERAGGPRPPGDKLPPRPPEPKVSPSRPAFSSPDDARKWAADHDIELADDLFDSVHIDNLDVMARAFDDMVDKYGADVINLDQIRAVAGHSLNEAASIKGIANSPIKPTTRNAAQFLKRRNASERQEYTFGPDVPTAAITERDIWLHEMGHVAHNSTPWMRQVGADAKYTPDGKSMIRAAMQDAGYANGRRSVLRELVEGDVSKYATSEDREFFAETFMLFNRPGGISSLPAESRARLEAFRDAINTRAGRVVL